MRETDHWLDTAFKLLTAETRDLRKLARIAGRPVNEFYRGANLMGADFRGQDLRGIDFNGADLSNVLIDSDTKLDRAALASAFHSTNPVEGDASTKRLVRNVTSPYFFDESALAANYAVLDEMLAFVDELIRRGETKQALAVLIRHERRFGRRVEYALSRGALLERMQLYPEALDWYRRSEKYHRERNPEILRRIIRILTRLSLFDEAKKYVDALVAIFPDDVKSMMILAEVLSKAGDEKGAIEIYRSLTRRVPQGDRLWARLAELLLRRDKPESAWKVIQDAHQKLPESIAVFRVLVRAASKLGRWSDIGPAILKVLDAGNRQRVVREIIRLAVKPEYKYEIQNIVVRMKLWEEQIGFAELGVAYLSSIGDIDGAKNLAERWYRQSGEGNRTRATRELASVLLANDEGDAGLRYLGELQNTTVSGLGPAKWLADALLFLGRKEEALNVLRDAHLRFPMEPGPAKWLIDALVHLGLDEEALQVWETIRESRYLYGKSTMKRMVDIETKLAAKRP